MEQMDQNGSHDGNTRKTRRVPLKQYWCFTFNNYGSMDRDILEDLFKKKEFKYIIGSEIGASGTPHLQGFVNCMKRIRLPEIVKEKKIHWEPAKAGEEANVKYCSKDGNYVTNIMTQTEKRKKLGIIETLLPWQQETITELLESTEREILWRWDPQGNTGKTALAKLLIFEHNALLIDGKKADILHGATEYVVGLGDTLFDKTIIFILDMSRTVEHFVSYDSIEKLKNGLWFSGKYEGKMIMIPPPKVIIFANFPPERSKLSEDRWNVKKIEKIVDAE